VVVQEVHELGDLGGVDPGHPDELAKFDWVMVREVPLQACQ
jgi:hypothetical protein